MAIGGARTHASLELVSAGSGSYDPAEFFAIFKNCFKGFQAKKHHETQRQEWNKKERKKSQQLFG